MQSQNELVPPASGGNSSGGGFGAKLAARSNPNDSSGVPPYRPSARFKAMAPSRLATPQARNGSYVFIPQGVSPAAFVDSPVLLSTNQPNVYFSQPAAGLHPLQERSSDSHSQDDDGRTTPPVVEKPAEDGYHWRKYGQKLVKGSEYPRSYYKCTHPGCPVKKKVETSQDGNVTERVYKGTHTHEQPTPLRKVSVVVSGAGPSEGERVACPEKQSLSAGGEEKSVTRATGHFLASLNGDADDAPAGQVESAAAHEGSADSSEDGKEDGALGEKRVLGDEGGDAMDLKRRKLELKECPSSGNLNGQKLIREPRLVVQATSDVEILDDGYRWRKYGQKVVKGNPHPRSYYKCTQAKCPVRKHVERSSADPKEVITTYEGKHNHEVPVARTGKEEPSASQATLTVASGGSAPTPTSEAPSPVSMSAEQTQHEEEESLQYAGESLYTGNASAQASPLLGPDDGLDIPNRGVASGGTAAPSSFAGFSTIGENSVQGSVR
eukprot:jgi/Mesen1/2705/ME000167S01844